MPTIYQGIGIEALVDDISGTLRAKLNAQLDVQAAKWAPLDQARAAEAGVSYTPITLEPVDPASFHVGNVPSLVRDDLALDDYPYVAVTFEDAAPDPENDRHDHMNVLRDALTIHAIAKAEKSADGAEIVFRRAARMAEAIYAVVMGDSKLSRMLTGVSNPMRVELSQPFLFNPEGLEDQDWFWLAAGTQYAIKNYTTYPEEV